MPAKKNAPESVSSRLDSIEAQLTQLAQAIYGGSAPAESSSTIELTEGEIDGIADGIEQLDAKLSDRQRLYLLGIFGAAAHHLEQAVATEGAAISNLRTIQVTNAGNIGGIKLSDTFQGLTKVERGKLGSVTRPGQEVEDSIGVGVGVACVGVDWSKDLAARADIGSWRTNPAFDTGLGGRIANPGLLGGLPGGFGR